MNHRIKKKHRHRIRFSMLVLYKFSRHKMVPITKNDTYWTSCLRLMRVHHRQLEYRCAKRRNEK